MGDGFIFQSAEKAKKQLSHFLDLGNNVVT